MIIGDGVEDVRRLDQAPRPTDQHTVQHTVLQKNAAQRRARRGAAIRRILALPLALLLLTSIACSAPALFQRQEPVEVPTRTPAPAFTATASDVLPLVILTPQQTPGVIIVPPGVDPSSLIPLPATSAPPTAQAATPIASSGDTPTPGAVAQSPLLTNTPPAARNGRSRWAARCHRDAADPSAGRDGDSCGHQDAVGDFHRDHHG
ncbi:MAG: hypothetical protein HC802_15180 [Caldilineaceae bacterium]|nr:hypothetical protein [Caldilineaceae bacterium]